MASLPPEKQPAIDQNVQRTVERTALRKVRNLLDEIGAEEADDRRMRRYAYLASGILLLLLIFFIASLL
ncbi:MAG: hypothetical protein H7X76_03680 [Prolixibacteraceae bacterium]|nr:hypothetical protein [Burkholderiales bacterium]